MLDGKDVFYLDKVEEGREVFKKFKQMMVGKENGEFNEDIDLVSLPKFINLLNMAQKHLSESKNFFNF